MPGASFEPTIPMFELSKAPRGYWDQWERAAAGNCFNLFTFNDYSQMSERLYEERL